MDTISFLDKFLQGVSDSVSPQYKILISLTIHTIFIALYSVFIWKFYKFLASRDILELNLKQYRGSNNPRLEKFLAIVLYTVEYIIILPFLVIFWFAILSLFILILSESTNSEQILLISAAIIASTRITAYIKEELSIELAKILPFTVLAIFILTPDFLKLSGFIDKLNQIPSLFDNIVIFIIFIFVVEFILRGIYDIIQLVHINEGDTKN
jgi:hypothetical protein